MQVEIDGVVYESKEEIDRCEGCIAEHNVPLCYKFHRCDGIIWVKGKTTDLKSRSNH